MERFHSVNCKQNVLVLFQLICTSLKEGAWTDKEQTGWRRQIPPLSENCTTRHDFNLHSFVLGSVADISLSALDSSFFCYPLEEVLATEVVATITQSLNDASNILGCSKLILPDYLLHNICQELLHLAVSEPCGLRGALIDLCVDRGDQGFLFTVDQIAVDATLVSTFHVTLVLRLESGGLWPKVQKLFKGRKSPQTSARHQDTLRLSTSFRAVKRKLYYSGELLIEECCWPSTPAPD